MPANGFKFAAILVINLRNLTGNSSFFMCQKAQWVVKFWGFKSLKFKAFLKGWKTLTYWNLSTKGQRSKCKISWRNLISALQSINFNWFMPIKISIFSLFQQLFFQSINPLGVALNSLNEILLWNVQLHMKRKLLWYENCGNFCACTEWGCSGEWENFALNILHFARNYVNTWVLWGKRVCILCQARISLYRLSYRIFLLSHPLSTRRILKTQQTNCKLDFWKPRPEK